MAELLQVKNLKTQFFTPDGVVKAVYKNKGEAVKNLEPVVQLQSPEVLRVEGQVEVQDAHAL